MFEALGEAQPAWWNVGIAGRQSAKPQQEGKGPVLYSPVLGVGAQHGHQLSL